jgi:hypothetical protein
MAEEAFLDLAEAKWQRKRVGRPFAFANLTEAICGVIQIPKVFLVEGPEEIIVRKLDRWIYSQTTVINSSNGQN